MTRTIVLCAAILGLAEIVGAQVVELRRNPSKPGIVPAVVAPAEPTVEFLERSGVELFFQGPAQASTQLLKLRIGEPKGFNLPLYLFVGATGNALGGTNQDNETTAASLVNPLGGTLNVSLNNAHTLKAVGGEYTALKLAYQFTGKLLNGKSTQTTNQTVPVFTGFGDIGLLFQTAAWESGAANNIGVFWIQAKVVGYSGSQSRFKEIFGSAAKSRFAGYSINGGIEINNKINLKIGLFGVFGQTGVPLLDKPYVKIAFDYKK